MDSVNEEIWNASCIIDDAAYLVALTGAGISRESNVPTFRGEDGLWRNYDPMELATPQAFAKDPKLVWEWYQWRQALIQECTPNPAHLTLAKWESKGILKHVITQNVDNLHQRSGSKNLTQVHGNIFGLKCSRCNYNTNLVSPPVDVPLCPECGSYLRPDVVWFGESLDSDVMQTVYFKLNNADVIIVIGTSGFVQPAASFPFIVKQNGGEIIEVNLEETPITSFVDVHLSGKAGEILPMIDELLQENR
ncbi:MAG: NAD-dependent protein deacylase [Candidatus Thorarchaeota archaeon]